ncbi:PstS family phosphate ABC transporter substrate-binding protein [Rhodothermus marinus]|uniref:PstS family phosphate ABC transporter substrate-binding protein n=1 Tax=Rhodothermus marinus TaxID=29549 RepID=UPI0012BA3ED8|nr:PstS family phosphate ABC transporter substrate-binding protein [Rhodothermus marinus]BBM70153.1 phosphate ABC transporter substrate-binding protein [Rhodothermus marinus]BBM73139.1 phosphate ABC transporter substrate-binding protein [Rhodothermus marinus]
MEKRAILGAGVLLVLLLAGCGRGQQQEGQLSGAVHIDGSSTVYPLTEAVAEEFMKQYPGVRVTVGISGTGGGFSKFVRKETDINDASRPIRPVEDSLARQNGVEYIELPVAYDGIAIVVNPQNDWVECLTVEELRRIWEPNSTITRWNQVRPSFPDRPLNLYGAGTDSGTYDYFTAAIVGEEHASRSDFTASEDDNVLVQGVSGDPNALGFIPLAYYEENMDKLKAVAIDDGNPDNGEGCILPSPETVNNGTYQPLSRPIFIYVNAERANDPAVEAFVEFYLQHAAELAPEVGYVPLTAEAYELALERFRNRVTGSIFGGEGSQVGVRVVDLLRLERQSTEGTAE